MRIELGQRLVVETVPNTCVMRLIERDHTGHMVTGITISGPDVRRLIAALTACLVDLGE